MRETARAMGARMGIRMKGFERVLIANRGEIAIRIARAARGLGMESMSVFAPVDAMSLHTRVSSEATELRNGAMLDGVAAYLDLDALLSVARSSGCDCVHPGYGFVSENAEFARLLESAGIKFIGPSSSALGLFGNKVEARRLAQSLEIPVVPGSPEALGSVEAARVAADAVGYPVMLKAAGGGGGRGMRRVAAEGELDEAFERCRSEAELAFGNGAVFLERLIERPRHIEVQILADADGKVVHLFERDCSVQQRHQKVVEIAPAPGLDADVRAQIHADAIKLAQAAGYENAGTVEFLVSPESGEHFFIECNPRIQVEHTITEQVTGVDLVEAQFRIAAGESLEALGLGAQERINARGYAVQARVVATGAGTFTGYKEPSGPGIRVDGCGYLGYAPPPQFDPLFAKLIVSSGSDPSLRSALARTLQALDEFHVSGVPTNIDQLRAILSHADVQGGDSRTSLLEEMPATSDGEESAARQLLESQAARMTGPSAAMVVPTPGAGLPGLDVPADRVGVEAPMAGAVVEVLVDAGSAVAAGETLVVVSAMKMETSITAPVAGKVTEIMPLTPGDNVSGGQVVAVLDPAVSADTSLDEGRSPWQEVLDEVSTLQALAEARLGPESQERGVVRQRSRGKLHCRERIALFLDEGTFREVGSLAGFASYDADGSVAEFTPANHVGGWGKIVGRTAIVCADDFTSRGGHADGAIGQKSRYLDRLSLELKAPSVRLLDGSSGGGSVATMVPKQQGDESSAKESTGAIKSGRPRVTGVGGSFLPGHLGSEMYAEQLSTVPVVNVLLGSVVGIGAAKAVLGHFSVMVRDIAQLFVAGPPVVSHAMGYDITKEDLGGWHIHCTNGSVDNLAETEAEAAEMTRRFLSYLPSSVYDAPPVVAARSDDPPDRREDELLHIVPRKRTTTFDVRRVIQLLADRDSFFEVGPLWGTDQLTGFVRFNGYPLGVITSDSRHTNGGALTADGCDKLKRHLDLCDLFHIPVLNLIDNPGFAVGLEHEIAGTIRKGGEWMIAFAQVQIPIFSVLMRRSFGVAGNNYASPLAGPSVRVTWPAADVGGIPPEGGIEAAYKRQLAEAEDPAAFRAEIEARIESARGPVGPLNRFEIEEMIDPRDTRRLICEWVENAYRIASQPGKLAPRALQFRP